MQSTQVNVVLPGRHICSAVVPNTGAFLRFVSAELTGKGSNTTRKRGFVIYGLLVPRRALRRVETVAGPGIILGHVVGCPLSEQVCRKTAQ